MWRLPTAGLDKQCMQCTVNVQMSLKRTHLCTPLPPLPIVLCIQYLFWQRIFFHNRNRKNPRLPCIDLNVAIIWFKGVFRLRPYAVLENTEEQKRQKMFHTFKLSLARLNLVKNANRSDFKISKQILPVGSLIMSLRFVSNLEFARQLK